MPKLTHVLGALATASALASPARAAPTCDVTIERAPDDVRAVVEHWVAEQPRCATALAVEIEPRGDALHVYARDPSGQVRERIVPGADDAGVLIASWAADDGPPPPAWQPPLLRPPTDAVTVTARPVDAPATGTPHYLTIGGFTGIYHLDRSTQWGVRVAADLASWRGWTLGGEVALQHSQVDPLGSLDYRRLIYTNTKLLATVARSVHAAGFHARASLGLGGMYLHARDAWPVQSADGYTLASGINGVLPIVELAALVGYSNASWGIEAGPIATLYVSGNDDDPQLNTVPLPGDLLVFVGIQHSM